MKRFANISHQESDAIRIFWLSTLVFWWMEHEMKCQATNTTYTSLTAIGFEWFNQQAFFLVKLAKAYKAYDPCLWALCEQASNGSITDCNACQVTLHDRTNSENWNSSVSYMVMGQFSWKGDMSSSSFRHKSWARFLWPRLPLLLHGSSPRQVSDPQIQNIHTAPWPQHAAFLPANSMRSAFSVAVVWWHVVTKLWHITGGKVVAPGMLQAALFYHVFN